MTSFLVIIAIYDYVISLKNMSSVRVEVPLFRLVQRHRHSYYIIASFLKVIFLVTHVYQSSLFCVLRLFLFLSGRLQQNLNARVLNAHRSLHKSL